MLPHPDASRLRASRSGLHPAFGTLARAQAVSRSRCSAPAAEHAQEGPRRPQRSEDDGPHLASPQPGEHNHSIALFGLHQALFLANAGGAWDNAKKVVEVDLKEKGTALHDATDVGDTVGDPFKDTSSVAMNPIIKFTTLFGLLAVEMAMQFGRQTSAILAVVFFVITAFFVYRSFYGMRIASEAAPAPTKPEKKPEPEPAE